MSKNNFPDPGAPMLKFFFVAGLALAVFCAGLFAGIVLQWALGC